MIISEHIPLLIKEEPCSYAKLLFPFLALPDTPDGDNRLLDRLYSRCLRLG